MRIVQVGYIQDDDVRIYIQDTIHEQLLAFAKEDITHERGTFLIGNNVNEGGSLSTYITGFIEARYTEATATSLTFTHETWNYVHRELAANYPNKKIIGWQHTHPGLGVFLSSYDLFIHENYFDLPFLVAYVIDPVRNKEGFFQWKNGGIEQLKGYYICLSN